MTAACQFPATVRWKISSTIIFLREWKFLSLESVRHLEPHSGLPLKPVNHLSQSCCTVPSSRFIRYNGATGATAEGGGSWGEQAGLPVENKWKKVGRRIDSWLERNRCGKHRRVWKQGCPEWFVLVVRGWPQWFDLPVKWGLYAMKPLLQTSMFVCRLTASTTSG